MKKTAFLFLLVVFASCTRSVTPEMLQQRIGSSKSGTVASQVASSTEEVAQSSAASMGSVAQTNTTSISKRTVVRFEYDNGSQPRQIYVTRGSKLAPSQKPGRPAKTNFSFLGWSAKKGDKASIVSIDSYVFNTDTTFYALWEPYALVKFDFQDGISGSKPGSIISVVETISSSYASPAKQFYTPKGAAVPAVQVPGDPIKKDYQFLGWGTKQDDRSSIVDVRSYVVEGDVTFYAIWRLHRAVTVRIDLKGGVPLDIRQRLDAGEKNIPCDGVIELSAYTGDNLKSFVYASKETIPVWWNDNKRLDSYKVKNVSTYSNIGSESESGILGAVIGGDRSYTVIPATADWTIPHTAPALIEVECNWRSPTRGEAGKKGGWAGFWDALTDKDAWAAAFSDLGDAIKEGFDVNLGSNNDYNYGLR